MEIISHRINSLKQLQSLDPAHGAEIDVRSRGAQLILHHDPHQTGEELRDFLQSYARQQRGTLILNPKEDGLEEEILKLLREFSITRFFFLDLTLPTTVKLTVRQGIKNVAVRVSEYEPVAAVEPFKGLAEWVWIDSFSGQPIAQETLRNLKRSFKTCLVSPELQGYPPETIVQFKSLKPWLDAVCTKYEKLWL